jgi:hypothetical protein
MARQCKESKRSLLPAPISEAFSVRYLRTMKNGATTITLLLLVAALSHVADCMVVTYIRKVSVQIMGKDINNPSVLVPATRIQFTLDCNATVTYKKTGTRFLSGGNTASFDNMYSSSEPLPFLQGYYTTSVSFKDNAFKIGDSIQSFRVSCIVAAYDGATTKVFTSNSTGIISSGDIPALWVLPLSVKAQFLCEDSGTPPRKNFTGRAFCLTNLFPEVKDFFSNIYFSTDENGRFSHRTLINAFQDNFYPTPIPLTRSFSNTSVKCYFWTNDPEHWPEGLEVLNPGSFIQLNNSGSYDYGTVMLRENATNKEFC